MFEFEDNQQYEGVEFIDPIKTPVIKVIGVGGAGGNAINNMINSGLSGVEFIAANTDSQVLELNKAPNKIHLGINITRGHGAGGNPEVGQRAAIEDAELIMDALRGADIVFVTAGMGGGTGTGASPVIASIAKELGALTIAVVSMPFIMEGPKKNRLAEQGLAKLKNHVDSYVVVANDKVSDIIDKNTTFKEACRLVDNVLLHGVKGISDTIVYPGLINVDFADIKTLMQSNGAAIMGVGIATGENRDVEALEKAFNGPLLVNTNIQNAFGILVNITAGDDFRFCEFENIGARVAERTGGKLIDGGKPNENEELAIFIGVCDDGRTDNSLSVTIFATGLDAGRKKKENKVVKIMEDYGKSSSAQIIKDIGAVKKQDKQLMGFDEANESTERLKAPAFLRNQLD